MKHSAFALGLILVLAVPTAGSIGGPTPALAQEAAGPAPANTTPMLEALSLLPPGIDAFEFTHWSALKAAHGGADVTSASPLVERQRLLLDVARSEATTFSLGLDRLSTWSDRWGWDTTDLEWQASCCGAPDFTILRFREDWDAESFMARLEADGYERRDTPHATSFSLEPGTEAPDRDYLERVLGIEGPQGGAPTLRASAAFSPDGRTVVLVSGPDAHEILKLAAGADPAAVVDGPLGRHGGPRATDGREGLGRAAACLLKNRRGASRPHRRRGATSGGRRPAAPLPNLRDGLRASRPG